MNPDYTTSGFDKFLSRGGSQDLQGPLDQETPNKALPFDRTQVSGAPGDTYRVGNIFIDGVNGQIYVVDKNNNKRVILGTQNDGSEALTISKEGKDSDINRPSDLLFNSNQSLFQAAIVDNYTFPGQALAPSQNILQQFKKAHNIQGVPGFLVYYHASNNSTANYFNIFPSFYYTLLTDHTTAGELGTTSVGSTYGIGIDDKYLYVTRSVTNFDGSNTLNCADVQIKYYIFQQTIN